MLTPCAVDACFLALPEIIYNLFYQQVINKLLLILKLGRQNRKFKKNSEKIFGNFLSKSQDIFEKFREILFPRVRPYLYIVFF